MKKLLALMKLRPGETAEQFAKRIWQSLTDRNLVDSQNKLVLPNDKQESEITFLPTYKPDSKEEKK